MNNLPPQSGVHRRDFENCVWQVMDIEEKELDQESWGRRAIYIKNRGIDLCAVNCPLKALKCDGPTLFISQIIGMVVDYKLKDFETFGCIKIYIETTYLMWIMTLHIVAYGCWAFNDG